MCFDNICIYDWNKAYLIKLSLDLNHSHDIICNSLERIETCVLGTLDQNIASGSTDNINAIIIDSTFGSLRTLNNYMLPSDLNIALSLNVNASTPGHYTTTAAFDTLLNAKQTR